ncbi:conserved hypothetical protein [Gammaproteobacteria bacterium]
MSDVLKRLYRKLRIAVVYPSYRRYVAGLGADHPLQGIPTRIIGDASEHDASEKLPVPDAHYDVFTSTASLPLIGLGRYGDSLDPNCLPNLLRELNRVMKPDGSLIVSMSLGPNVLNFNNSWFLDMPTIERVFKGWTVVDHLIDRWSSPGGKGNVEPSDRFTRDTSVKGMRLGLDYLVIFLHLRRSATA